MDPITIALGLAQFAPMLLRYLGVGDASVKVAEKVINIAQIATGQTDPEKMRIAMQEDREALVKFQELAIQNQQELERLYYTDVASARERDAEFIRAGKINTRANWLSLLAIVVVVALTFLVWSSPDVNDYVKGIITLVLGRFLGYLDQIFNFEFGTTRTSREKDSTISRLSEPK